jgi:hypothetical protein
LRSCELVFNFLSSSSALVEDANERMLADSESLAAADGVEREFGCGERNSALLPAVESFCSGGTSADESTKLIAEEEAAVMPPARIGM